MGQVLGASKPSPSFKQSKTKQLGMWWVLVNIVQWRRSQSHVDTRLRCFALLQWMIVGLLKEIFKWSLSVANKGKLSWCFYVKKLIIIHIDLGHLNPENVTCLSAKEFQTTTIVKLTDKPNHKWKV